MIESDRHKLQKGTKFPQTISRPKDTQGANKPRDLSTDLKQIKDNPCDQISVC